MTRQERKSELMDMPQLEFAPMEGITDHVYRSLHHRFFPGVDRYYTPFLSPAAGKVFSKKELEEVLPENNAGIDLVPQLLTGSAEQFLAGANILRDRFGSIGVGCFEIDGLIYDPE